MAKSSQIIKAILEDIQKLVRKIYDSEGLKTVASDMTIDRQLFTAGSPGWVNAENMSSLIILTSPKEFKTITIYPDLSVAIVHKDVYSFQGIGYSAGEILLQGKTFGNLMEPGVVDRLKKHIKQSFKNWAVNAKF